MPYEIRSGGFIVEAVKIAIVYYSATGNVHNLATAYAQGAADAGAEVRVRRVSELAPEEAIAANPAWIRHRDTTAGLPVASHDDIRWADGIAFGTPTRFGNVSSQLKQFLDSMGGLWTGGELAGKTYSGFTSASTLHGGHESTLLALYNSFYHFGGFVVSPGYTDPVQFVLGNPYGPSHTCGSPTEAALEDVDASAAARYAGNRLATVTATLLAGAALRATTPAGV